TSEPALAQASGCDRCQSASLLRPIPASGPAGTDACAWTTAQRVGEGDTPISRAATMERPQIPPIVQTKGPEGGQLLPLPLTAGDEGKIAAPPPTFKPRGETLPAPRPLNGDKVASGYPELPPPVITHPLDAPREFEKRAVSAYIIEPPDVLAIEGSAAISDP